MINIDGSYGEGGGQIIRTAVALSAVTGIGVAVNNIRVNRPKPGLKAQHLTAIKTAAEITGAEVSGLKTGSIELTFKPHVNSGGYFEVDIGTAGSITLLLQCLMPVAACADGEVTLDITGGTDVSWSPPIDYMTRVLLPVLAEMGLDCSIKVYRRGYYPRGGGRVSAVITPSELKAVDVEKRACKVGGISHCSNLPPHVAQRQADAATGALERAGYSASINVESSKYPSTGSGITLWCNAAGGSALGKRGLPAEKVGRTAAGEIIAELGSWAAVDVHLGDQLIPYMGLAGGGCFTVREVSGHTQTNIWVVEQFLSVKFKIETEKELFKISL